MDPLLPRRWWLASIACAVIFLSLTALWGWWWHEDRDVALGIGLAVAIFYYGGKAVAIPTGIAAGVPPLHAGLVICLVDVASLLLLFPLTQARWEGLPWLPAWLRARLLRLAHGSGRWRTFVKRRGGVGLFVVALIPVSLNSPVLGAALGHIVGLRMRVILAALLSEIVLMSAVWTVVGAVSVSLAQGVSSVLPWILVGALVVAMGLGQAVRWARARRALPQAT